MKRKLKLLGATGIVGVVIASVAISDNRAFDECMAGVIVDVMPIEGESWQQHSARMDEAARSACRDWS